MDAFDVSVDVNVPPEKLWTLVSDLDRIGEWSPECIGVKWKGAAGPQVGNKFKGRNRNGRHRWATDCKIVASTPNEEIAWESAFLGFRVARWGFKLEPTDGGTKLHETWKDNRNPLLKVPALGAIVTGVKDRPESNQRSAEATLQRIKTAAEAG